jgi:hypothetical protein
MLQSMPLPRPSAVEGLTDRLQFSQAARHLLDSMKLWTTPFDTTVQNSNISISAVTGDSPDVPVTRHLPL